MITIKQIPSFTTNSFSAIPLFLGIALLMISQLAWSATIGREHYYTIDPSPLAPTTSDILSLRMSEVSGCIIAVDTNKILIDSVGKKVDVSLSFSDIGFLCPGPSLEDTLIPVGNLARSGDYQVSVYDESESSTTFFNEGGLVGTFNLTVAESNFTITPEVPAADSTQSGVGIVRGWACDATNIEVAFDDGARLAVAYGTAREDTRAICGDANNGYGMVIAWGLLGQGAHTMTTFMNGDEISQVTFDVGGLDDPFAKGLSGSYDLDDFPVPGQTTTVQWSEPAQNFIIIEQQ